MHEFFVLTVTYIPVVALCNRRVQSVHAAVEQVVIYHMDLVRTFHLNYPVIALLHIVKLIEDFARNRSVGT